MIIIMSPEIKKPSECPNTGIRITVLGSKHTLHVVDMVNINGRPNPRNFECVYDPLIN